LGLVPLIVSVCENIEDRDMMLQYLMVSANELDEVITNITDKSSIDDFQNLLDQFRKK